LGLEPEAVALFPEIEVNYDMYAFISLGSGSPVIAPKNINDIPALNMPADFHSF
jgi:hypothetical protein